jgi:hypothetical protein
MVYNADEAANATTYNMLFHLAGLEFLEVEEELWNNPLGAPLQCFCA